LVAENLRQKILPFGPKRVELTYRYLGPSVFGKIWDPRILPQWPMDMIIGTPVATFDGDARLWVTIRQKSINQNTA
jgi:hypothetical protein